MVQISTSIGFRRDRSSEKRDLLISTSVIGGLSARGGHWARSTSMGAIPIEKKVATENFFPLNMVNLMRKYGISDPGRCGRGMKGMSQSGGFGFQNYWITG